MKPNKFYAGIPLKLREIIILPLPIGKNKKKEN